MISLFERKPDIIYAVHTGDSLSTEDIEKLNWLFGEATFLKTGKIEGSYVGPRKEMITPWSTNAVEITQNMGINGIRRIEEFFNVADSFTDFDPMLSQKYLSLDQAIYTIDIEPEEIQEIEDIAAYNKKEGLALSDDEIDYLEKLSEKLNRKLTDSEVFGFSQVNSEHCRHKIFNGTFVIDGKEMPSSLFKLIKKTSEENPNGIISAYKDNVAFIKGPNAMQFAPKSADKPDFYEKTTYDSVISLKAETHNFPTTVEPFNGAATGSGGEIRDRLAGGKGSLPLAGTAVYMTSYSRLEKDRPWEDGMDERQWLYQHQANRHVEPLAVAAAQRIPRVEVDIEGDRLQPEQQRIDQHLAPEHLEQIAHQMRVEHEQRQQQTAADQGCQRIGRHGDLHELARHDVVTVVPGHHAHEFGADRKNRNRQHERGQEQVHLRQPPGQRPRADPGDHRIVGARRPGRALQGAGCACRLIPRRQSQLGRQGGDQGQGNRQRAVGGDCFHWACAPRQIGIMSAPTGRPWPAMINLSMA